METGESYVDFVSDLDDTLTLGGRYRGDTERTLKELASPGSYFTKAGVFYYWDTLDAGGKSFQAKSYSGFIAGPLGLYLKPSATGEIIYDMRAGRRAEFQNCALARAWWSARMGCDNTSGTARGRTQQDSDLP